MPEMKAIAATLVDRLANTSLVAASLMFSAGVALGLAGSLRYAAAFELGVYGPVGMAMAAMAIGVVALVLAGSVSLARRETPLPPRIFLLALLGGGALLHLVLVWLVRPDWGTDHLRYWEYAARLVAEGKYGGMDRPYYARALFFPYPVVRLFGPDATFALKFVNVLCLGAIQLAAYDILRRVRSHQSAQATAVLLLAAPMPAFATLIPSHDLWGLTLLSISFWMLCLCLDPKHPHRLPAVAALAACSGIVAYLTEVQRNLGLVYCASAVAVLVIVAATHARRPGTVPRARLLVVAAALLGAYIAASTADDYAKLRPEGRPVILGMKLASNAGGMGTGKSDWAARFRQRFGEGYSTPERVADLAVSSGLSSWALAPLDRATRLATHAARLYSLTYPRDWNWMLRRPEELPQKVRDALVFYCDAFGIAFGILLLISSVRSVSKPRTAPVPTLVGTTFLVVLSLCLLLVFENKPYNIFPIWLIGALLIGTNVDAVVPAERGALFRGMATWMRVAGPGAALLLVLGLASHLLVKALYTPAQGRLLADWSLETNQPIKGDGWKTRLLDAAPLAFSQKALSNTHLDRMYLANAGSDGQRLQRYAGHTVTSMSFPERTKPGDQLSLSTKVCAGDDRRTTLEFFLYVPGGAKAAFGKSELRVLVGDRHSNAIAIPPPGRDFQRFELTGALVPGACERISFNLRTLTPGADPSLEIWMPRLVKRSARED